MVALSWQTEQSIIIITTFVVVVACVAHDASTNDETRVGGSVLESSSAKVRRTNVTYDVDVEAGTTYYNN